VISTTRQWVVLPSNWGLIAGMNRDYFILYLIYTSSVAHPASKPNSNMLSFDIYIYIYIYGVSIQSSVNDIIYNTEVRISTDYKA